MMKKKIKLYMDYDGTLVNSIKSFVEIYNWLYSDIKERDADWTKVRQWNFQDECTKIDPHDVEKIFADKRFFNILEFYPEMRQLMYEYCVINKDVYEVYIVSKGTKNNLKHKKEWIKNNLPFMKEENIILMDIEDGSNMSKSSIDMSDGIIIDDNQDCLKSSNAKWKILFTWKDVRAEWNKDMYYTCLKATNAESLKMNIKHITDVIQKQNALTN